MKRKFFLLSLLCLLFVLSVGLSACGKKEKQPVSEGNDPSQEEPSGGDGPQGGEDVPDKEPEDLSAFLLFSLGSGGTEYAVAGLSERQTEGYVVIPESYEGLPVTQIGEAAFADCFNLTGVTIPQTVTKIGNYAFSGCELLTALAFPEGLEQVGEYLVKGCVSLSSITVEEGCEAYFAEGNCLVESETKTLVAGCAASEIPPLKVQTVAEGAFADQRGLEKIYFPAGVREIGRYAFLGCSGLKEIQFAGDMREIGDGAFSDCRSLTRFFLPYKTDRLGSGVLAGCDALTQILVSQNNTRFLSVGNCLIERASGILKAGCSASVIPTDGSVIAIGAYAFSECEGLEQIDIPAPVQSIGVSAFAYCRNLKTVTLAESVNSVAYTAFSWCSSLAQVTFAQTQGWSRTPWNGGESEAADVSDPARNAAMLGKEFTGWNWSRA